MCCLNFDDFFQARSIHELAKKNFENLRQDSDDNEPEPKVVRRGRPPTKNLKKPLGRPSLERAGSEFSDATLATGAENAILSNYDRSRNNDVYASWLADNKFERNDDLTGLSHFFYAPSNLIVCVVSYICLIV